MSAQANPPPVLDERQTAVVRAEVDRVLASAPFAQSARQQRFLRFIVGETLAGRTEKLKGYTIGVEVFDREPDFDPAVDAIVRVEAARLRAKLREYYEQEGRGAPVRFELPKGAYTPLIHVDTPSDPGAVPQAAVAKHDPAEVSAAPRRPAPIEDRPSLAVLPFVNMSSDREQEYFADGITDSLITELSRISELFVISRHSSFYYKEKTQRAEEIGAELGVRYLVEGGVQRAGNRVRISARLTDVKTGAHTWAERYDRQLEDVFALQDDVTRQITSVLQVKLGSATPRASRGGTASVEAHDALLRGLERFWLFTPAAVEEARTHFVRAVESDSGYATGHAWLARALVFQWIMMWSPAQDTLDTALEHARRAVDLDAQLPLAHSMLGWVQLWRREGEASVAAGWKAIALDPNNADAHLFLAMSLVALVRGEEALHYIEKGIRLNPHPSAVYMLALGFSHYLLEDYERAITAMKRGTELSPVFIPTHYWLCLIYTQLGREDEARTERDKVLALTTGRAPAMQPRFWATEESRTRMQRLEERAGLGPIQDQELPPPV